MKNVIILVILNKICYHFQVNLIFLFNIFYYIGHISET